MIKQSSGAISREDADLCLLEIRVTGEVVASNSVIANGADEVMPNAPRISSQIATRACKKS